MNVSQGANQITCWPISSMGSLKLAGLLETYLSIRFGCCTKLFWKQNVYFAVVVCKFATVVGIFCRILWVVFFRWKFMNIQENTKQNGGMFSGVTFRTEYPLCMPIFTSLLGKLVEISHYASQNSLEYFVSFFRSKVFCMLPKITLTDVIFSGAAVLQTWETVNLVSWRLLVAKGVESPIPYFILTIQNLAVPLAVANCVILVPISTSFLLMFYYCRYRTVQL